jgi:hypothetical protein
MRRGRSTLALGRAASAYNQSGSCMLGACGLGASPAPGLRESEARAAPAVHVNTAGLHALAAMGLSGRLLFDISNHGLC